MEAPISALSVAGKFIQNSFSEDLRLTNMQLQKMVYVANGLYIALTGNPLIKERVEVWSYGPVIKSLYNELKQFGSGNITVDRLTPYNEELPIDDESLNEVMKFTWKTCKDADGIKLSNWSHAPNSPWTKASQEHLEIIPNKYMEDYFKKFVKKTANV